MTWRGVMLGFVGLCAGATAALAYTGGPEYIEVHGWDPGERKVYCEVHRLGDAPCRRILAFPLDRLGQSLATRLRWSSSSRPGDLDERRWGTIRRRLQPLELLEGPALPYGRRIVLADTLHDPQYPPTPRFRVRIGAPISIPGPELEVVTLIEPTVTFQRVYRIPGRSELLAVLSFIGQIYGPEEVQVPVLLRDRDAPLVQVEWVQCEL